MSVDFAIGAIGVLAVCVLWASLVTFNRKLVNPAWILAVPLFIHAFAVAVGAGESILNSSLIGPTLLVCGIAFPVLLRSPRQLLNAAQEPTVQLWVAFLAYCALTIAWSPNRQYGFEKVSAAVAIGLLPGGLMYIVYRYSQRLAWSSLLAAGTLYALLALAQGSTATGRLTTEDSNPIWIARTALVLLTIAVWDRRAHWLLRLTMFVLAVWVAVAAQSRGPVLACIAASLIVLGMRIAKKREGTYRRVSLAAISIGVAALLVLIVVLPSTPSGTGGRGGRLRSLVHIGELRTDADVMERLNLQRAAIDRFMESPALGGGLGSSAPRGERLYPHNVPLELLAEVGILGLALWMSAIWRSLRNCRDHPLLQVLLLQVVFYSLTSGDLAANNLIVVVSVFTCIVSARAEGRSGGASNGACEQDRRRRLAEAGSTV